MAYILDFTWLYLLAPALLVAFAARRGVRRSLAIASSAPVVSGLTGARLAGEMLSRGCADWVTIVEAADRPPNWFDAPRRTLRLSARVGQGGDAPALGIAAHAAGRVLLGIERPWTATADRALLFARILAADAAWTMMLAAVAIDYYGLFLSGTIVLWLALLLAAIGVPIERTAARRADRLLAQMEGLGPSAATTLAGVLEAASWEPASAVLPRLPIGRRPDPSGRPAPSADVTHSP